MASSRRPSAPSRQRDQRPSARQASGLVVDSSGFRMLAFVIVFGVLFLLCFARLLFLQVIAPTDYSQEAQSVRTQTFQAQARRGTIYDRNGCILACSVEATTVTANPSKVVDAKGEADAIASVLGGEAKDYQELLEQGGTFVYIKRQVDVEVGQKLRDMNLAGIEFHEDMRREYPYGEVGGQIIGFCNKDGEGVVGLEAVYDSQLRGTAGTVQKQYGASGTPIPGEEVTGTPAQDGRDIMISLDITMQAAAETILKDYAELWGVDTEMILMDGGTGEIYAAASLPLFNPADPSKTEDGATVLKPIVQTYEPGSIFKTVSAMSVLTHGTMTPESRIDCPAELEANGYIITDAHEREDTNYSLREIIQYSSNVGISLAVEEEGFSYFYQDIVNWGLNDATGVDFFVEGVSREPEGYLLDFANWSKIQGYNITFGQGITVSPLQMVRFYGALANDGVQCTPHFLIAYPETQEQVSYGTNQIITDQQAIADMKSMLASVVTDGTAKPAAIEGYTAVGKTGTAEVAEEGGYKEGVYNISFTGFLDNSSSKLVCFAGSIELPADGSTAAMFKDIMSFAIDRYKISSNVN